jgi:hypothetical protein
MKAVEAVGMILPITLTIGGKVCLAICLTSCRIVRSLGLHLWQGARRESALQGVSFGTV